MLTPRQQTKVRNLVEHSETRIGWKGVAMALNLDAGDVRRFMAVHIKPRKNCRHGKNATLADHAHDMLEEGFPEGLVEAVFGRLNAGQSD